MLSTSARSTVRDVRVVNTSARSTSARSTSARLTSARSTSAVGAADGAVFPEVRGGTGAVAGLTRCAAGARAADVMDVIAIVRMRSFVVVACCVTTASNWRGKKNIDVNHLFLPIVFWN